MTNTAIELDTLLFSLWPIKSRVAGTYFGEPFTGTVTDGRQNTVTYHEQVTVELDAPIKHPGKNRDGSTETSAEPIIIRTEDILKGWSTLKKI